MNIQSSTKKQKPRSMPASVMQGSRILGRTGGRPSFLFSSMKGIGICPAESPLEKVIGQLASLDPRVVTVCPQPFTVDVVSGQILFDHRELSAHRETRQRKDVRRREYTPDFEFILQGGQRVAVEVKDPRFPCSNEYWEKVGRAERIMFATGRRFHVVNMIYEPSAPLAHNAGLLTALLVNYKAAISQEQIDAIEAKLPQTTSTLSDAAQIAGLSLRESPILILHGVVSADLSRGHLRALTPVNLGHGELQHLAILRLDGEKK